MAKEREQGGQRERRERRPKAEEPREQSEYEDAVVRITRTAAVVKGGRRFSFNALVVVGNRRGKVGIAMGKANEVPNAVEKGRKHATKNLVTVPIVGHTIAHQVKASYGASTVLLKPAKPGTGLVCGPTVRAVCELAGITDIVTKCYGATNPLNLLKATMRALAELRSRRQVEALRGVVLDELGPYPDESVIEVAPEGRIERPFQREHTPLQQRRGKRGRDQQDGEDDGGSLKE